MLPAEIQKLPALEGYLCIAGYDRAREALQWAEPKRRAPAFVLRRESDAALSEPSIAADRPTTTPELRGRQQPDREEWG